MLGVRRMALTPSPLPKRERGRDAGAGDMIVATNSERNTECCRYDVSSESERIADVGARFALADGDCGDVLKNLELVHRIHIVVTVNVAEDAEWGASG